MRTNQIEGETAFRKWEGSAPAGLGLGLWRFGSGCFGCGCRRVDLDGDGGQRINTIGAEAVTAIETLEIIEDAFINGGTDAATGQATGGAAD